MTELLGPVDVEAAVVSLLDGSTSANVATAVPNPRPTGGYVRVTRAGGGQRNLIQSDSRLLIECWHDDEVSAFDLARRCWALLWAAQDSFISAGVYATRIDSGEPVNFPDPDTGSPRYQFLSTLTTSLTEVGA